MISGEEIFNLFRIYLFAWKLCLFLFIIIIFFIIIIIIIIIVIVFIG